ncbi:hypothetical protein A9G42_11700 [Gilliamella sp. Nev6-6]|uniref:hypothetical protein n=1 Tax=Gilliamella sp. Nev6-6 TaxID=3120252 RepID=UPI00080F407E|nr:hypothetical protein [Gilliamella apicola]OCG73066.1 hypothetical protein A9G42_11700 [Gilliamella apicola]
MVINSEYMRQLLLERERFDNPPDYTVKTTGVGIARFVIHCNNDVDEVLNLAKRILVIVNYNSEPVWPSFEEWLKILPDKFINNCAKELTKEELKEQKIQWDNLTYEQRLEEAKKDQAWTLSDWLGWLEPDAREWFWWNAHKFDGEIENTHFLIEVTALDDPFPSGALKWLFKACGAIDVISTDDI